MAFTFVVSRWKSKLCVGNSQLEDLGVAFFATGPSLGLMMYIFTTLEFRTHNFDMKGTLFDMKGTNNLYRWSNLIDGRTLLMVEPYWWSNLFDSRTLLIVEPYWWSNLIDSRTLLMIEPYWWSNLIDGRTLLMIEPYW